MKFCVVSSDPLFKYYEKGEIKPRYWNPQGMFDEVFVISFCHRDVAPELVQELVGGARLEIIPIGPPAPHLLLGQYRRVGALARRIQPDLIRAHNPWHAGLLGLSAKRAHGAPLVISLHTHYDARRQWEGGITLRLLKIFERLTISRADQIQCVSHYLTDYAKKMGGRAVEVIYNRVDTAQFDSSERNGARREQESRRPRLLAVGRLDPPKDQACLIRAIQGLDVDLDLVGDGVNRSRLAALAAELGVAERVRFVGNVPHREIQKWYNRADLFVTASYYEGFCIPVLEAMAAGLPIVVNDIEPLPEILGGTGRVVEHLPDAFRRAIADLLEDGLPGRCAAARNRARTLDGTLMEQREAELYRRLIESPSR